MIPNHLHFIFGLDPTFGGKPFSFIHYLAIRSAVVVNRPEKVNFYYAFEPSGYWWDMTKPLVNRLHVDLPSARRLHFAHKADLLRLEILLAQGGIYLDVDTFCVNRFEPLLGHKTVLGIEPNAGLCNAVILAERNSEFISEWLRHYRTFDGSIWNYHSVRLPYRIAMEQPSLVHVEGQYSFFFPSYDDPMCDWLWRENLDGFHRVEGIRKVILNYFTHYRRGEGPKVVWSYLRHAVSTRNWYRQRLRDAFCLHLWESLWWEKVLRDLDLELIRQSACAFADLVRQVIPDLHADMPLTTAASPKTDDCRDFR